MSEKKKKSKKTEVPPPPAGHADTSGCYGCQYHDPSPTAIGSCNFCYITGHARGSTVEACARKIMGQRLMLPNDIMLVGNSGPKEERKCEAYTERPWEQPKSHWSGFPRKVAWEMYQNGENDEKIAKRVGVTRQTIRAWRNKHGLPANPNKGRPRKNGTE